MYGGIEDAAAGNKIQPTADVYSMKLHLSKCRHQYSKNQTSYLLYLIEVLNLSHISKFKLLHSFISFVTSLRGFI
jgi:hypothetical protein